MSTVTAVADREALRTRFHAIRSFTESLAAPLGPEDQVVQSMPDVSPTKWHRGHTTWFFETFLLQPSLDGYAPYHPAFVYLFNSYYEAVGPRHPRPLRGLLSRPTVEEVARYRAHVDVMMDDLISRCDDAIWPDVAALIELGLHHEQQHQELLLMDIKHVLSCNPLEPAYAPTVDTPASSPALRWSNVDGGFATIGHGDTSFSFDNETPQHTVLVEGFAVANRLATVSEWIDFIEDGGYTRSELWLSDGWYAVQEQGWNAPLYWDDHDGAWTAFTLQGRRTLRGDEPVIHVSHYEADAFARWSGARLPTEFEWEHAVAALPALAQITGEAWQWTSSAYLAYPRFAPAPGAVGEYNGKFMSGQMVLRGGARITPDDHTRPTYRNFFPPGSRWMYSGVRLAKDAS